MSTNWSEEEKEGKLMENRRRADLGINLPQRKWTPQNSEAHILGTPRDMRAKGRKQISEEGPKERSRKIPKSTSHPEGTSREIIGMPVLILKSLRKGKTNLNETKEGFASRSTEADPKYRIYYNTVVP
ncbi:conserved hypothetical protein [Theileria orientalis strain Shintoku]|uniref:Uncharacterized protein n=1 Tax=Theileria orientalis strain Shintoku TaxID=869250 RepID=J4C3M3_THEOR|nr:LOW QUALITY PROTEIN: conserved hypothetical protein [Theileria orientalis strain Shintoku]BAM40691.1 conserved hypothetical protein [Theileria orientalis strain Shintoku]|eukprot:XP_009690992.1 LOW QUALITY PROTEIN: conserved hypothetical protein [Theileria orientalis strain Shintoku]